MKVKREVKLALTAIAAVVILIWGINFLKAKALFDRNNVFYGIYDRVDGLKVSSSVIYRGYSVGQVSAIQFTRVNGTIRYWYSLPWEKNCRYLPIPLLLSVAPT